MLAKMNIYELREELNKKKEMLAGLKAVLLAWLNKSSSKEAHMHLDITNTTAKKSSSSNKTTRVYSIA